PVIDPVLVQRRCQLRERCTEQHHSRTDHVQHPQCVACPLDKIRSSGRLVQHGDAATGKPHPLRTRCDQFRFRREHRDRVTTLHRQITQRTSDRTRPLMHHCPTPPCRSGRKPRHHAVPCALDTS